MVTNKTNIKSNIAKTLLIILGIVLALFMSFNSGLFAMDDTEMDILPFGNPYAKEVPAPEPNVILETAQSITVSFIDKIINQ